MAETSQLDQPIVRYSPSTGPRSPHVWGIYEPDTGSIQYVCADPSTRKAALIDVVLDFDPASFSTSTRSMERVLDLVAEQNLKVEWILDTHPHADHAMASAQLRERTGARTGIGEKVADIAKLWRGFYNMPDAFDVTRDFDRLFADGDTFQIGDLEVQVMLSPGHTLGSITYVCGDAAFVHDTFMQPDSGTSRADFPGGSSSDLWDSLQAILSLPGSTRLFIGHDYGTDNRDQPEWETTVDTHRRKNIHVGGDVTKAEFLKTRDDRDATLGLPDRMLAVLQINLRGGRLPETADDGERYLKIPLNRFGNVG
ncbi:MBL fold metallo-hydrolase [Pseudooctadecabacter sp.]|uniref:MBL fold metallo-hydrolase n=1 Tax=Pseudooctadecabacter sp. TaxID=1966338 RepID=UPI0035C78B88